MSWFPLNYVSFFFATCLLEHSYQAEYLGENSKKWGGGSKSGKHQPPQIIENPWLMNKSSTAKKERKKERK